MNEQQNRAIERLEANRREFTERLTDLRESLAREFGWAPKAKTWALPLVGFAAGFALAFWLKRRR